jgi:hypothetical protein
VTRRPGPPRYLAVVSAVCRSHGWPEPEAEVQVVPERRWRFDLAWRRHLLAVEVQGGLFVKGRHTQGAALVREFEKLNAAAVRGWAVLLVTPEQVTGGPLTDALGEFFGRWYSTMRPDEVNP